MPYKSRFDQRRYDRERYHKKKRHEDYARARKVNFTMRLPEQMLAVLQRLAIEGVAKGTNPWRTPQEVGRALLALGLQAMKGEHDTVDEYLPHLRLEEKLSGLDRAQRSAEAMYAMAKKNIKALLDIDADDTALQYYATTITEARELPKTVWSRWLIGQLEKTFPALAEEEKGGRVPGVQLGKRRAKSLEIVRSTKR